MRPMQDPSARSLVSLSPSIGMTRVELFSETRSTARLWLRLRRSLRVTGGGIRRLAQAVPFSMGMTAKRFKTNFKLLRFNKQKRQARGLAFFNYGIRACDRAASPPGPSEIQSWAFRNSRSEMPAKREYYHSSLFFACISPTAPQAMTPRRMAASTTNTMICQSGMRYPITSPFMALELASE